MRRHHFIILVITLLSIIIPSLLIYQIVEHKNSQIRSVEGIMFQEAKSHFDDAVITRKWNAQFGGVYVKKTPLIEPNPYLENNHIFSDKGEILVKINPAWMTRQISELSNAFSSYYFKITSLNPLNPNNKADTFEQKGLEFFEKNKEEKYFYEIDKKSNYFNFIGSLKVDSTCLACHAKQNYKIGDVRGGIRVSVPIATHNAKINQLKKNAFLSIILVVGVTAIINILMIRFILIIVKKNEKYYKLNKNLEEKILEEIEKNKEKEKILSQQSKMAALGEMLNNIAHQWRQPLSTITTATSGMQLEREMNILTDETFNKTTKTIMDQANHMSKTIDDFRKYSQNRQEQEKFILKELIFNDIELIKSAYSANNIVIEIDEVIDNLTMYGFPNELAQAILNILNNSKDQFRTLSIENKIIKISTVLDNNSVKILIQDNAGGIPKNIIDRIFEPYFTTKHQSQGTGIGLYMTQKIIVEHLKGDIVVSNKKMYINKKEYKGACFTITLPLLSELV